MTADTAIKLPCGECGRPVPADAATVPEHTDLRTGCRSICPASGRTTCYAVEVCSCYSCDKQCGGTIHPDSCGPVEADAEGRPICRACRELAQVWGDHRTGVQATVCQDRVRVQVKFGESAWLNPESARALAGVLMEQAARLDKDREADALTVEAPK